MDKEWVKNYVFAPAAADAGTITLTDYTGNGVLIERLALIVNVTKAVTLYQFGSTALAATVGTGLGSNNIITLHTDTSSMANTDKLMIIYKNQIGDPQYEAVGVNLMYLLFGEDYLNQSLATLTKPGTGSAYAPLMYQQNHSVSTANIKAATGNVFYIEASNETPTAKIWLQLFNTTTVPTTGAGAQENFEIAAGTPLQPSWIEQNISDFASSAWAASGFAWGLSTTYGTYTPAPANASSVKIRSL